MKWVLGGIIALLIVIMLAPQLNLRFNLLGAILIVAFGFLFVTVSSRLTGEIGSSSSPISGMTVATLLLTCLIFLADRLDRAALLCHRALHRRHRLHRVVERRHNFAGSQDRFPRRLHAEVSTDRHPDRHARVRAYPRSDPDEAESVRHGLRSRRGQRGLRIPAELSRRSGRLPERQRRPAETRALVRRAAGADPNDYFVYHKTNTDNGPAGRYLVNNDGMPVYLADPGINGVYDKRPDGSSVQKFTAPKATLVSYIIKGILGGQLPWGLVLLGVFIAIVLELSGVSALAFAVGVYLPISTSAPIYVGGMVRWLVDRYTRRKHAGAQLTEDQLVAEGDKSNGVLLSSGYIAGGTLAGVLFAFLAIPMKDRLEAFEGWATAHNPFFNGPHADLLALIPFIALCVLLYVVGRDLLLASKAGKIRKR